MPSYLPHRGPMGAACRSQDTQGSRSNSPRSSRSTVALAALQRWLALFRYCSAAGIPEGYRSCGRRNEGNLSGSICRDRGAFRSGVWGYRRSYLRICRDAARRSPNSSASDDISAVPGDRPPLPTIVFHDDRDTIVHPRNADHVITRSMRVANWQTKVRLGQVPGGHAYTCTIPTDANGQAILEQWCIHARLVGR
jgi:hypothetical protein